MYLALTLWRGIGLEDLCERRLPAGKQRIAWAQDPSVKSVSERSISSYPAGRWSGSTAEAPHGSAGLELRRFRLLDLYATDTDI